MSTLAVTTIKSQAASTPPVIQDSGGTEVGAFCRAWVYFNGQGTVAIQDSFNVSSITDNGTGDYTVNLTNAISANHACVGMSGTGTTAGYRNINTSSTTAPTATTHRLISSSQVSGAPQAYDAARIQLAFFSN